MHESDHPIAHFILNFNPNYSIYSTMRVTKERKSRDAQEIRAKTIKLNVIVHPFDPRSFSLVAPICVHIQRLFFSKQNNNRSTHSICASLFYMFPLIFQQKFRLFYYYFHCLLLRTSLRSRETYLSLCLCLLCTPPLCVSHSHI